VSNPEQGRVLRAMRQYQAHLRENIEAGRNIILLGPSGTGKPRKRR
jgi:DNA replication protein DnaC